jgi:hypothetical protein
MDQYSASKSWQAIGRAHDKLLAGPDGWNNFRSTVATRYFTDPKYTKEDITAAYDFLLSRGVRVDETDFADGNPLHVVIDGRLITQDLLISASELHSMEEFIDFETVKTFVEIGGGYGRMALLLLQRYPHIQYTIVDVPPAIHLSLKYLYGKFPVHFLSPQGLKDVGDVDVFYTSSVMSELDFGKVSYYFDLISKKGNYLYLKDWKKGHHLNSMPFMVGLLLRGANKICRLLTGRGSKKIKAAIDRYRISEGSYPTRQWKEVMHRDCEDVTGYSPSHNRVSGKDGFFEAVYQIR